MAPPRQFAGHPWSSCEYEPKRRPFKLGDTEVDFLRFACIDRQFARVAVRYQGWRAMRTLW